MRERERRSIRFWSRAAQMLKRMIGAMTQTNEMTRGCVKNAVGKSPDRSAKSARVLPQVKQGMPVYRRNGQSMTPQHWQKRMRPHIRNMEPIRQSRVLGRMSCVQ